MKKNTVHLAFISYSHADEDIAEGLYRFLCHFKLPRPYRKLFPHLPVRQYDIFIDQSHLHPGALWSKLKEGLSSSEHLIVICSQASAALNAENENWVNKEIEYFIETHPHAEELVFPILLEEAAGERAIPAALTEHNLLKNAVVLDKNNPNLSYCQLLEKIFSINDGKMWKHVRRAMRIRKTALISACGAIAAAVLVPVGAITYLISHGIEPMSGAQLLSQGIQPHEYTQALLQTIEGNDAHTLELLLQSDHPDLSNQLLMEAMSISCQKNQYTPALRLKKVLKDRTISHLEAQGIKKSDYPAQIQQAVAAANKEHLSTLLCAADDCVASEGEHSVLQVLPKGNTEIRDLLRQHARMQLVAEKVTPQQYEEEIILAALDGDLNKLRLLLLAGASADSRDAGGDCALSYAARNGHLDCLKELLENGADINYINKSSNHTSIFYALYNEHEDCIRHMLPLVPVKDLVLIEDDTTTRGDLLQSFAIENKKQKSLKVLLEYGLSATGRQTSTQNGKPMADISLTDSAIAMKSADCLKLLLDYGADPNEISSIVEEALLVSAIGKGSGQMVQHLIDAGADINVTDHNKRSLMDLAAANNAPDVIRVLHKAGADVESVTPDGKTPLMTAAATNSADSITALLECGANPERKINGLTLLSWTAACCGNSYHTIDAIQCLIRAGADINATNEDGTTALMNAAINGRAKNVQALIDAGANLEIKQKGTGLTALTKLSGFADSEDIIRILCQAGADINTTDNNGDTPIYHAIANNRLKNLEVLIQEGANVNIKDKNGLTPLCLAVAEQNHECVRLLCQAGANVSADVENGSPLQIAVLKKSKEIVEELLRHGADREIQSDTASLIMAIAMKQEDITNLLLNSGANINSRDSEGQTPLMAAVATNNEALLERLLKSGADPSIKTPTGLSLLESAVNTGNINIIQILLDNGIEQAVKQGKEPNALALASSSSSQAIVELLLKAGADPNQAGNSEFTPLQTAIINQHTAIARALLEAGADASANIFPDTTLLQYTVMLKQEELTRLLLNHGASKQLDESLKVAVIQELENAVEALLEAGANPDITDGDKFTLLSNATLKDSTGILRLLLAAGANVNSKGTDGRTALRIATVNKQEEAVRLLLSHGATEERETSLILAILAKNENIVKALLEAGTPPDCYDNSGDSPLICAAMTNQANIIHLLAAAGANISYKRPDGNTALHIALKLGHEEAVRELLEHGGAEQLQSGDAFDLTKIAVIKGSCSMLKALLAAGASPNACSSESSANSLLITAVYVNNTEIIQLLLEHGADMSYRRPSDTCSALEFAIINKRDAAFSELLKHEMPAEIKDEALFVATVQKAEKMALALLQAGAGPHFQTADGVTPLIAATFENMPQLVQALIKSGADIHHLYNGMTALQVAEKKQFTECIQILKTAQGTTINQQ